MSVSGISMTGISAGTSPTTTPSCLGSGWCLHMETVVELNRRHLGHVVSCLSFVFRTGLSCHFHCGNGLTGEDRTMRKTRCPNSKNRSSNGAKKNSVSKVECGCRKTGANYWPVTIQFFWYVAKSLYERLSE